MKGEIEGKKGPFDALKMLRRIKNLPSGMAQEGSKTDQSSDEDLHLSNRHSVGKGRQSSKGRGMDGPGSHCPPLSGRDDREAKANWQKRSGRENMGQRAKSGMSLPSALDQGMAEDDISRMQGAAEKELWLKHGRG